MTGLGKITLAEQIKCVQREIALRERVYPRWVKQSKMKQISSDYELAAMRAVLSTLKDYGARLAVALVDMDKLL